MGRAALVSSLVIAAGCGRVGFALLGGTDAPVVAGDGGTCATPTLGDFASEGQEHQDAGLPITWNTNPPTSGTHYPEWVVWNAVYETPIDRGYWVHNLEHGGTVFTYHCDPACPDELARLRAMLTALPADADCPALVHRAIVVEDPLLPAGVRFAASAWQHSWTGSCLDEAALTVFHNAHLGGMAPEPGNCAQGTITQ